MVQALISINSIVPQCISLSSGLGAFALDGSSDKHLGNAAFAFCNCALKPQTAGQQQVAQGFAASLPRGSVAGDTSALCNSVSHPHLVRQRCSREDISGLAQIWVIPPAKKGSSKVPFFVKACTD